MKPLYRLLVPILMLSSPIGNAAVSVLNPSGGLVKGDGLKIITEGGAFEICREGIKQIYDGDCETNTVGDLVVGLQVPGEAVGVLSSDSDFDAYVQATEQSNILTSTGKSWTNVTTMTGAYQSRNYQYVITTRYTSPNEYADLEIQVTVPDGLSVDEPPPTLWIASDFYLNGEDDGPGLSAVVGRGQRYVVQYQGTKQKPTAIGGLLEAKPEKGVFTTFSSWMEGYYSCTFGTYAPGLNNEDSSCFGGGTFPNPVPQNWNQVMGPGSEIGYPNWVNDSPEEDAGVGASWVLPRTAGTYTIKTVLYFSGKFPAESSGGGAHQRCLIFGGCTLGR